MLKYYQNTMRWVRNSKKVSQKRKNLIQIMLISVSIALKRAQEKLNKLPGQFPRGLNTPNALKALHEADVEFNYCFYYPTHEPWRNFPSVGQQGKSARLATRTLEWRIKLRDLVGKCMNDGTLQDLKDGKIRVDEQSVDAALRTQHLMIDKSTEMKQTQIPRNQTTPRLDPDQIRDTGKYSTGSTHDRHFTDANQRMSRDERSVTKPVRPPTRFHTECRKCP